MTRTALEVLYIDNHLIAVVKPFGLLTQAKLRNEDSLLEKIRQWLKEKYNKPGNVYLGLLHRLDRNVSGIVLFARTSKAASRLSKQFRESLPKKIYRAIVHGKPKEARATLVHYLQKGKSLKSTVFPRKTSSAKRSELSYKVVDSFKKNSLIEITLYTGRFHQIRAQMAFIGYPIMGDIKYGAPEPLPNQKIALFACKLIFIHPVSNKEIIITASEPDDWEKLKT